MKKHLCFALLFFLTLAGTAQAGVNVHHFYPVLNPSYIQTEDSMTHYKWGSKGRDRHFGSFYYDLVNDPIVELDATTGNRMTSVVESTNCFNFAYGYGVLDFLQVGASTGFGVSNLKGSGLKFRLLDSRIMAKLRLTSASSPLGVAVMPFMQLPTGSEYAFLSDGSVGLGFKAIVEYDFKFFQLALNAGYKYAKNARYRDLNLIHTFPVSLGILVPLGPFAVNAEVAGILGSPIAAEQNESAYYVGGKWRIMDQLIASLGLALGAVDSDSSGNVRFYAGITFLEYDPSQDIKAIEAERARGLRGPKGEKGDSNCITLKDSVVDAKGYKDVELKKLLAENIGKELPYYFTKQAEGQALPSVGLLSLGRTTPGLQYVKDSEVVFEFNYRMPNKNYILKDGTDFPVTATISLELVKKKSEKSKIFNDTEIFCSIDNKVCSGTRFHNSPFKHLLNPDYEISNKMFSDELKSGIEQAVMTSTINEKVWKANIQLDVAEVFGKNGKKMTNAELIDFLYSNTSDANMAMTLQKLRFVVADDTMVQRAFLTINYAFDGCSLTKHRSAPEKK